ncbi:hypothetical protein ACHAWT_006842 [Skeletonema menzelii]
MADRLSLGREHRRLRQRRTCSSSDEHQLQHCAIIFVENQLEAGQDKITGELVKLKRIMIPRSDDDYHLETASRTLYLCIYEELSTQIIFPDVKQSSFNNYIDDEYGRILSSESLPSKNEIQSDCIDSIAFALSSWYANSFTTEKRDVSRADVESVCNILSTSIQLEPAIDRYCSCYDDECSADPFISSLRLDLDANARYLNNAHHKQSDSPMTTPLRLIVTGDPTSGCTSCDTNSTQMGVKILRRSIPKMPLISLVLQPEGNASEHASILDDHLLRACVKRLLIGRVLLHSGNTVDGHAIIRTSLSVKVPAKPSLSNRDELVTLQFRVADIQSRNKHNDNDQIMYVILPSTRIIFQAETPSSTMIQEAFDTKEIELEKPSCRSKPQQIISTPHQQLVDSLRILVHVSDQQNRPLIPRAFLFSGPPGVGKTYAVKKAISVANSWVGNSTKNSNGDTVRLVSLRGSELLAMSGGSNATTARVLEGHFEEAAKFCRSRDRAGAAAKAVVLFLDECDALVSSHVVAAKLALLLDKMEGVVQPHSRSGKWGQIIVVGATNRVDVIPAFLRRPGRMEKEVVFSPPNADERFSLLKTLLSDHDIPHLELQNVAEECVGYVAADLSALVRKAAMLGIERNVNENNMSCEAGLSDRSTVTTKDLITAMIDTPASCLRDASLSAPPKTTWDDIAGDAGGAKTALRIAIEWPRTRKEAYSALGLSPPRGVLLHGPPGCAKTTLARAAAGSAGVSFLSLAPADVYSSSFVGDAEAVVRRAFDLARSAAPCVLFFDEIDAIIGGEVESGGSHGMDRGGSAEARVLSTFLNEMDGVDGTVDDGVLVLAATNRPGTLDAALLRPGRFDKVIYVPSPDKAARAAILRMECNKWYDSLTSFAKETFPGHTIDIGTIEQYFNIDALACDDISGSMTGAEIKHACAETAINVMRESLMNYDSLDHNPALVPILLNCLKNGLEKALRGTKPLLASSSDEYLRFDREHRT